mmetsp:Transcript_16745/g.43457  ORF Transcript_16745/g.43457 Transcript_16745/m.43457 type:complete len:228 (+) Transcript_16745:331-1014(+)
MRKARSSRHYAAGHLPPSPAPLVEVHTNVRVALDVAAQRALGCVRVAGSAARRLFAVGLQLLLDSRLLGLGPPQSFGNGRFFLCQHGVLLGSLGCSGGGDGRRRRRGLREGGGCGHGGSWGGGGVQEHLEDLGRHSDRQNEEAAVRRVGNPPRGAKQIPGCPLRPHRRKAVVGYANAAVLWLRRVLLDVLEVTPKQGGGWGGHSRHSGNTRLAFAIPRSDVQLTDFL